MAILITNCNKMQYLCFKFVVAWKGIHAGSDTNRIGAEGLSFYYPRLLYYPVSDAGSDGVEPASGFVVQKTIADLVLHAVRYI